MGGLHACLVLIAAAVLLACGGKVESGSSTPYASDGGDNWSSSVPLPPCVLGPPHAPGVACSYLADGRCYEKKLAACACACPKDHDSTCMSDFPSDNVPATVSCF